MKKKNKKKIQKPEMANFFGHLSLGKTTSK